MSDKRGSDRTETNLPGSLISEQLVLPCTVLDVSATGARLQIQPGMFLPKHFTLRAAGIGVDRLAAVVWRNRTQMGIRFEVPPPTRPPQGERRSRPR